MKPCQECPFKKDNILGRVKPGGSDVEVYLGQASGPFHLACHLDKNYAGKQTDAKTVSQCRGAAIFRSNIEVAKLMPEGLLILPEDKKEVFGSNEEMYAYYKNVPIENTKDIPKQFWNYLVRREMSDGQVKRVKV